VAVSPLEKRRADSALKADRAKIPLGHFLCSLLFLFVANSVWAVDPHTLISQYGHTAWRIRSDRRRDQALFLQSRKRGLQPSG
jgi:hypothetical protein